MATPRKRFASYPREVRALFPIFRASASASDSDWNSLPMTCTSLPSPEDAKWMQRVFNIARTSAIHDRKHSYREVKLYLATCSLVIGTRLYIFSNAETRKQFRQEYQKL